MVFNKEIIIQKPIEVVWEVLGGQFGEAYQWASGLYHSQGFGIPEIDDAQWQRRACKTSQGPIKEELLSFDPNNYHLEYKVIEGFPSFVDKGINRWQLTKIENTTKVNMHLTITTKGIIGAIMGPLMRIQMNNITADILSDLKHYVELGKPSPKKQKELSRYRKEAA